MLKNSTVGVKKTVRALSMIKGVHKTGSGLKLSKASGLQFSSRKGSKLPPNKTEEGEKSKELKPVDNLSSEKTTKNDLKHSDAESVLTKRDTVNCDVEIPPVEKETHKETYFEETKSTLRNNLTKCEDINTSRPDISEYIIKETSNLNSLHSKLEKNQNDTTVTCRSSKEDKENFPVDNLSHSSGVAVSKPDVASVDETLAATVRSSAKTEKSETLSTLSSVEPSTLHSPSNPIEKEAFSPTMSPSKSKSQSIKVQTICTALLDSETLKLMKSLISRCKKTVFSDKTECKKENFVQQPKNFTSVTADSPSSVAKNTLNQSTLNSQGLENKGSTQSSMKSTPQKDTVSTETAYASDTPPLKTGNFLQPTSETVFASNTPSLNTKNIIQPISQSDYASNTYNNDLQPTSKSGYPSNTSSLNTQNCIQPTPDSAYASNTSSLNTQNHLQPTSKYAHAGNTPSLCTVNYQQPTSENTYTSIQLSFDMGHNPQKTSDQTYTSSDPSLNMDSYLKSYLNNTPSMNTSENTYPKNYALVRRRRRKSNTKLTSDEKNANNVPSLNVNNSHQILRKPDDISAPLKNDSEFSSKKLSNILHESPILAKPVEQNQALRKPDDISVPLKNDSEFSSNNLSNILHVSPIPAKPVEQNQALGKPDDIAATLKNDSEVSSNNLSNLLHESPIPAEPVEQNLAFRKPDDVSVPLKNDSEFSSNNLSNILHESPIPAKPVEQNQALGKPDDISATLKNYSDFSSYNLRNILQESQIQDKPVKQTSLDLKPPTLDVGDPIPMPQYPDTSALKLNQPIINPKPTSNSTSQNHLCSNMYSQQGFSSSNNSRQQNFNTMQNLQNTNNCFSAAKLSGKKTELNETISENCTNKSTLLPVQKKVDFLSQKLVQQMNTNAKEVVSVQKNKQENAAANIVANNLTKFAENQSNDLNKIELISAKTKEVIIDENNQHNNIKEELGTCIEKTSDIQDPTNMNTPHVELQQARKSENIIIAEEKTEKKTSSSYSRLSEIKQNKTNLFEAEENKEDIFKLQDTAISEKPFTLQDKSLCANPNSTCTGSSLLDAAYDEVKYKDSLENILDVQTSTDNYKQHKNIWNEFCEEDETKNNQAINCMNIHIHEKKEEIKEQVVETPVSNLKNMDNISASNDNKEQVVETPELNLKNMDNISASNDNKNEVDLVYCDDLLPVPRNPIMQDVKYTVETPTYPTSNINTQNSSTNKTNNEDLLTSSNTGEEKYNDNIRQNPVQKADRIQRDKIINNYNCNTMSHSPIATNPMLHNYVSDTYVQTLKYPQTNRATFKQNLAMNRKKLVGWYLQISQPTQLATGAVQTYFLPTATLANPNTDCAQAFLLPAAKYTTPHSNSATLLHKSDSARFYPSATYGKPQLNVAMPLRTSPRHGRYFFRPTENNTQLNLPIPPPNPSPAYFYPPNNVYPQSNSATLLHKSNSARFYPSATYGKPQLNFAMPLRTSPRHGGYFFPSTENEPQLNLPIPPPNLSQAYFYPSNNVYPQSSSAMQPSYPSQSQTYFYPETQSDFAMQTSNPVQTGIYHAEAPKVKPQPNFSMQPPNLSQTYFYPPNNVYPKSYSAMQLSYPSQSQTYFYPKTQSNYAMQTSNPVQTSIYHAEAPKVKPQPNSSMQPPNLSQTYFYPPNNVYPQSYSEMQLSYPFQSQTYFYPKTQSNYVMQTSNPVQTGICHAEAPEVKPQPDSSMQPADSEQTGIYHAEAPKVKPQPDSSMQSADSAQTGIYHAEAPKFKPQPDSSMQPSDSEQTGIYHAEAPKVKPQPDSSMQPSDSKKTGIYHAEAPKVKPQPDSSMQPSDSKQTSIYLAKAPKVKPQPDSSMQPPNPSQTYFYPKPQSDFASQLPFSTQAYYNSAATHLSSELDSPVNANVESYENSSTNPEFRSQQTKHLGNTLHPPNLVKSVSYKSPCQVPFKTPAKPKKDIDTDKNTQNFSINETNPEDTTQNLLNNKFTTLVHTQANYLQELRSDKSNVKLDMNPIQEQGVRVPCEQVVPGIEKPAPVQDVKSDSAHKEFIHDNPRISEAKQITSDIKPRHGDIVGVIQSVALGNNVLNDEEYLEGKRKRIIAYVFGEGDFPVEDIEGLPDYLEKELFRVSLNTRYNQSNMSPNVDQIESMAMASKDKKDEKYSNLSMSINTDPQTRNCCKTTCKNERDNAKHKSKTDRDTLQNDREILYDDNVLNMKSNKQAVKKEDSIILKDSIIYCKESGSQKTYRKQRVSESYNTPQALEYINIKPNQSNTKQHDIDCIKTNDCIKSGSPGNYKIEHPSKGENVNSSYQKKHLPHGDKYKTIFAGITPSVKNNSKDNERKFSNSPKNHLHYDSLMLSAPVNTCNSNPKLSSYTMSENSKYRLDESVDLQRTQHTDSSVDTKNIKKVTEGQQRIKIPLPDLSALKDNDSEQLSGILAAGFSRKSNLKVGTSESIVDPFENLNKHGKTKYAKCDDLKICLSFGEALDSVEGTDMSPITSLHEHEIFKSIVIENYRRSLEKGSHIDKIRVTEKILGHTPTSMNSLAHTLSFLLAPHLKSNEEEMLKLVTYYLEKTEQKMDAINEILSIQDKPLPDLFSQTVQSRQAPSVVATAVPELRRVETRNPLSRHFLRGVIKEQIQSQEDTKLDTIKSFKPESVPQSSLSSPNVAKKPAVSLTYIKNPVKSKVKLSECQEIYGGPIPLIGNKGTKSEIQTKDSVMVATAKSGLTRVNPLSRRLFLRVIKEQVQSQDDTKPDTIKNFKPESVPQSSLLGPNVAKKPGVSLTYIKNPVKSKVKLPECQEVNREPIPLVENKGTKSNIQTKNSVIYHKELLSDLNMKAISAKQQANPEYKHVLTLYIPITSVNERRQKLSQNKANLISRFDKTSHPVKSTFSNDDTYSIKTQISTSKKEKNKPSIVKMKKYTDMTSMSEIQTKDSVIDNKELLSDLNKKAILTKQQANEEYKLVLTLCIPFTSVNERRQKLSQNEANPIRRFDRTSHPIKSTLSNDNTYSIKTQISTSNKEKNKPSIVTIKKYTMKSIKPNSNKNEMKSKIEYNIHFPCDVENNSYNKPGIKLDSPVFDKGKNDEKSKTSQPVSVFNQITILRDCGMHNKTVLKGPVPVVKVSKSVSAKALGKNTTATATELNKQPVAANNSVKMQERVKNIKIRSDALRKNKPNIPTISTQNMKAIKQVKGQQDEKSKTTTSFPRNTYLANDRQMLETIKEALLKSFNSEVSASNLMKNVGPKNASSTVHKNLELRPESIEKTVEKDLNQKELIERSAGYKEKADDIYHFKFETEEEPHEIFRNRSDGSVPGFDDVLVPVPAKLKLYKQNNKLNFEAKVKEKQTISQLKYPTGKGGDMKKNLDKSIKTDPEQKRHYHKLSKGSSQTFNSAVAIECEESLSVASFNKRLYSGKDYDPWVPIPSYVYRKPPPPYDKRRAGAITCPQPTFQHFPSKTKPIEKPCSGFPKRDIS